MAHTVTLRLPEDIYSRLKQTAQVTNKLRESSQEQGARIKS